MYESFVWLKVSVLNQRLGWRSGRTRGKKSDEGNGETDRNEIDIEGQEKIWIREEDKVGQSSKAFLMKEEEGRSDSTSTKGWLKGTLNAFKHFYAKLESLNCS